jgi:hypothetical protein
MAEGREKIGLETMPRLEKWKNDGLNGNLEPPELEAKHTQGVLKSAHRIREHKSQKYLSGGHRCARALPFCHCP